LLEALIAGIVYIVIRPRILSATWRFATLGAFLLTALVFPIPLGMFLAIFLSTIRPGTGVFGYLLFPTVAALLLVIFGLRWPLQDRIADTAPPQSLS
jgi:hypothetical protein